MVNLGTKSIVHTKITNYKICNGSRRFDTRWLDFNLEGKELGTLGL